MLFAGAMTRTPYRTAVFFDRMVMPRSFSSALESMMRSSTT